MSDIDYLFMHNLEEKLLRNAPTKPCFYARFIDDIFMIFDQGEEKLKEFINYMNTGHDTIKFTAEYSRKKISFLDVTVKVDRHTNRLYTELFTKETDTQNYLHYSSAHPKHCKRGVPKGEFLRIRRNCTKLEDFDIHSEKRVKDYQERGYPLDALREAQREAREIDRNTLLQPKKRDQTPKNQVPLVLTFNPANPNLKHILEKHWHLLRLCRNPENLPEKPLIAYRRNKNLADKLVRAKCNRPTNENNHRRNYHEHPCLRPWRCNLCQKPNTENKIKSSVTGREYRGPKYTCNTRNVVYLITCKKCGIQYVGESHRTFKDRMKEHYGYARRKEMDKATGLHYNLPGHNMDDMHMQVIYVVTRKPIKNDPFRVKKEIEWMERLRTLKPLGLNERGK